jgi:sulfate adenylyltransferase subunit 2
MTKQDLLTRAERYAKKSGLTLSTVSGKILLDGSRLREIKEGGRIFPETLEAAFARLEKLEAGESVQ